MSEAPVRNCDVCGLRPPVGVCCCSLGAVSFGYCRECLDHHAEPFELMHWVLMENGPQGVADWVKQLTTFRDGKYLTWDEFVALDGEAAAAEFKATYGA